jgi:hypothetical protein
MKRPSRLGSGLRHRRQASSQSLVALWPDVTHEQPQPAAPPYRGASLYLKAVRASAYPRRPCPRPLSLTFAVVKRPNDITIDQVRQ